MKYRYLSVLLFLFTFPPISHAQVRKVRPVHIGFIYPLSTNGFNAREYTNVVSFHAIAGISRSETSLCASGFSNLIYDRGNGAVFAGFSNHIMNQATGVQCAGFVNTVRNNAKGLQAAGFFNLSGYMKGAQSAGFCNIVLHHMQGFQAAGFSNLTLGNVRGLQAAGFLNMADRVDGAQVAGFVNISDDVNTQVAGFVNVARDVKGVQLSGFMNVAEHSDYPIGFVNIIKDGTKAIGVSIDENGTSLASFRSGGRVLYGILGAGFNFRNRDPLYVAEAGIGAHFKMMKDFDLNLEGVSESLTNFDGDTYIRSSIRLLPTITLGHTVDIFAGPALSHIVSDRYANYDLPAHELWSHTGGTTFNALYMGAMAGVQIHL